MNLKQFIFILFLLAGCQSSVDSASDISFKEQQPDYVAIQRELEEVYEIDQSARNID